MDVDDLDPDPVVQFTRWLEEAAAAGVRWPGAMTVATVGADGRPSARAVLLRGHDERGFTFFTNRVSRKGRELASTSHAALVFYWEPLDRQVRVEGAVSELSSEESTAYFRTRPRGSQLAAWASPQSRPLGSREELERLYREAEERFGDAAEIPLPPFWGGYRVRPDVIELWQGREHRLHDRIRYERSSDTWSATRLAP
jgi:pyridoxamine 5'-phosphate oxidase